MIEKQRNLTTTELEILKMCSEGYSDQEISAELSYSYGYIRRIYERMYDKTGMINRPHLISWAYREGVLK